MINDVVFRPNYSLKPTAEQALGTDRGSFGRGGLTRRQPTVRLATALVSLFVAAFTPIALGQSLVHELYVLSLDCDSDVINHPRDEKEYRSVHVEWISETDLKISFWQIENAYEAVRRNGSLAMLNDGKLSLSVETEEFRHQAESPYMGCSWPALVTFIVHGIARGPLEVEISGGRVEPSAIVGG